MVTRTDTAEPGRDVIEAAACWQAQLADEDCDEESRRAFQQWLQADVAHGVAFDRMSTIAGQVTDRSSIERTAFGLMMEPPKPRNRAAISMLVVGAVSALTWMGAQEPAVRSRLADQKTAVGEQQHTAMPTGDRLVLDSDTAADVDDRTRAISLWRGGLMATVAKDQVRGFVVRTPQGTARALGTQFSVRIEDGVTTVSVIESRVEACSRIGNGACLILTAGQSARMDAQGVRRIADIDPVSEKAWGDGLLVVDDRPLVEVIAQLNRYRHVHVRYSGVDLHGLHVSGTFPLTDPDRALTSLQAALPIVVERDERGTSVRRR